MSKVLACSSTFQLWPKEESKKICLCTDSPVPGLSPSLRHTWAQCLQDMEMLHGTVSFLFLLPLKTVVELHRAWCLPFVIIKLSHKGICFIVSSSYICDFLLYSHFPPADPPLCSLSPIAGSWFGFCF